MTDLYAAGPGQVDGLTAGPDLATLADRMAQAQRWLAGQLAPTPVLRCEELDRIAGARLWLKCENLQRGGSFKMRGALMALAELARIGSRGVLAQSTGNHAVAVALAAGAQGLDAVLVLPSDAAPGKVERIRRAGAEVIQVGTTLAERVAVVQELRLARGLDVVDPYENPQVLTGQGTATADLIGQVAALGADLDAVVVPVGGGSGVAGACVATAGRAIAVIGAEPLAVPALTQARLAGTPVTVPVGPTVADGLRPDRIGNLPFSLARDVADVVLVEEDEIVDALRACLVHARLLIEPAAATGLAAALRTAGSLGPDADVGVVLTGGNVEASLVSSILGLPESGL